MALLAATGACSARALPESIWPPHDFEISVEEIHVDEGSAKVVRRFRALADGVVSYGTATESLRDEPTGTMLPVFDRLSVYELVPTSIRALARRIDRCGILELDRVQGERGVTSGPCVVVTWNAFGRRQVLTARGRVHGAMAEILAIVIAHLPTGETFGLPGLVERPVVPVLRGVPTPSVDAEDALSAHQALLERRPDDLSLMLDTFALACRLRRRGAAEGLMNQWSQATAEQRRVQAMFPEEEPRLSPEILARLLP